jgi:hypothetical protein
MENGHQFYLFYIADTPISFASVSYEADSIFKLNKLYVLPSTQKPGTEKTLLQRLLNMLSPKTGNKLFYK